LTQINVSRALTPLVFAIGWERRVDGHGPPRENQAERSVMPHRWEHFAHDADIGVRGIGDTLAEAFAAVGEAVTGAIVDPGAVRAATAVAIRCSGADQEDLLYAWINALVFEMAIQRMLFARFEVSIDGLELDAVAWGETIDPERHEPAVEVKGATMTALRVRPQAGEWVAECIIDV
jgi:tRNA nucleotidyltransferase (CCA-adding enzyme)